MGATTTPQIFGPGGDPKIQVVLPIALNLMSAEGSCELVVNTRSSRDTATWFEMYAAARAVQAMCVNKGEGGISIGQGQQGSIFVILKGGSQAAATAEE